MSTEEATIVTSVRPATEAGKKALFPGACDTPHPSRREGSTSTTADMTLEHEELRDELERTRRQLEAERRNNEPLKRQIHDLRLKLAENGAGLRREIATLNEKVKVLSSPDRTQEYLDGVKDAYRQMSPGERLFMAQQIETWKDAAEKWKGEAMRQGIETINLCWQSSVNEAVRKEREKDSFVIKSLQSEIEALKNKTGEHDS